jgi:hypothetical protein
LYPIIRFIGYENTPYVNRFRVREGAKPHKAPTISRSACAEAATFSIGDRRIESIKKDARLPSEAIVDGID